MAQGLLAPTITFQKMGNGDIVIRTYNANPALVNQNNQSVISVIRISSADWTALVADVAANTIENYASVNSFQYDIGDLSPVQLA